MDRSGCRLTKDAKRDKIVNLELVSEIRQEALEEFVGSAFFLSNRSAALLCAVVASRVEDEDAFRQVARELSCIVKLGP